MRLLLVTADFPPALGGMQVYASELARAWAPHCDLTLIAPRHPQAEATDAALPLAVRRVPHPGDSFAFSATLALRRAIADTRPDAIFATSWSCAAGALQARVLARRTPPVFTAAHGKELVIRPLARLGPLQRGYDALRRHALQHSAAVFPVSRYTASLLAPLGVPEARVTVVPNGVDATAFHPADASALRAELGLVGKTILLTVGRLVARKGIDTVLDALPALLRAHPQLVYVVVGDGPDRARIERLVAEHGLGSAVRLVGRAPAGRLLDYYNLCDVFVMPARAEPGDVEGFGLVFLEAGACAKPVVGARDGGVTDAVRDGVTGILVPPAAPAALAEALSALLGDPDKRAAMGAAGRAHALGEASWARAASRIRAVIAQHLG